MSYFHTVRHLKPVQIYSRLALKMPRARTRRGETPPVREPAGQWQSAIKRRSARTGPFEFRFLNEERALLSWNPLGVSKLWIYNLHYFEHPEPELIARWIAENPPGVGNGWEPYPLSLRIVNWIKYALAGGSLTADAIASLAVQTEFLAGRVEYHLLGNHLLANAKALVFAGAFFGGRRAGEWLTQGLGILNRQLPEQILRDGGHFERSPMYHSLVLEDLLDLSNLAAGYDLPCLARVELCGNMLAWLATMTHPDGEIAFFNDAATGIAPPPAELLAYANRLGIAARSRSDFLEASGYMRLESGPTVALFDGAPIGPDYQPGHAHADTLSFELSHEGHRIFVNSGTSTYQAGAERLRQRGTAAHNTVRIDDLDQSEVWGAFRVARRARPSGVRFHRETGSVTGEGAHDGYRRLPNSVVHRRLVNVTAGKVEVQDSFDGRGSHRLQWCFHVHPDVYARDVEGNSFALWRDGREIGWIRFDPRLNCRVEPSSYHPQFGVAIPTVRIAARVEAECPISVVSRIVFA